MNKLLLSIPVVLLAAWGGVTWYVGQQTETSLKQFIDQQNQATAHNGAHQELVSYEKGLLSSKAVTKVTFDAPPLNEMIGEVKFINDIQNGPVFFGGGSLAQFGSARIDTRLDMDSLDQEKRQWLMTAFEGKQPLEGHTVIGFGGNTGYDFTINPIKVDNGSTIMTEAINLHGSMTPEMTGDIAIRGGKVEIKDNASHVSFPSIQLDGDITGMVGGQALGNFDIKMPGVSILAEGTTVPTSFDLAMQTSSDVKDNELAGKVAAQVGNIQGVEDALNKLDYTLDVQGLDVAGLEELGKLQADMESHQSQMNWNADAMETPEGQQKQQELMDKINQTAEQVMEVAFGKVLKTGKSHLRSTLLAESAKGKLNADVDLTYAGQGAPKLMEMASFGPDEWGKMLKGKITLDADKSMLPAGFDMLVTPYEQQGLVKVEGGKLKSDLELAGDKATLNGKQMSFSELAKLVIPQGSAAGMEGGDPNMGIPEDLMQKINQEGLTPEVIQLLEESDDVPRETVEMLKQLQQIQQDTQSGKMPEEQEPEQDAPTDKKPEAKKK